MHLHLLSQIELVDFRSSETPDFFMFFSRNPLSSLALSLISDIKMHASVLPSLLYFLEP